MEPISVRALTKKLVVRFTGKDFYLPEVIQVKIDEYWKELMASGKPYRRGEVFTISELKETKDQIDIIVSKTDYAHYLYCQNREDLGEWAVRIVHTAGAVITKDHHIVFGQMGPQTAQAGKYQLCGGGLDNSDLASDGILDTIHNIRQEFFEEFGIDTGNSHRVESFVQKYLKTGGPTGKVTIISLLTLSETSEEFLQQYKIFEESVKKRGQLPEFSKIMTFSLQDNTDLQTFLENPIHKMDEYLKPFLLYLDSERA